MTNGAGDSADLSKFMTSGGCAAKVDSVALDGMLRGIHPAGDQSRTIVGLASRDDAAVIQLSDTIGMVTTVDVIPPPVPDPYDWGWIAAANAISDVYAMGGRPAYALSILGIPAKVNTEVARTVILGGTACLAQVDTALVGGHTIRSEAPFFGLAVQGTVPIANIWRKAGAKPGDAAILTRPIGTGVILSGLRHGLIHSVDDTTWQAIKTMNTSAADVLRRYSVHAATDVTGFGLANQLLDIAESSNVSVRLDVMSVPTFEVALKLAETGVATSLTRANREAVSTGMLGVKLTGTEVDLLFDPQTNGGLLVFLPANEANHAVEELRCAGLASASLIGHVCHRESTRLILADSNAPC